MTLQEIDDALAAWNGRLAAVAGNLLELQADESYRLLNGSGGAVRLPLFGATAARVQPALSVMNSIFEHFDLLRETLAKAGEIRAGLPALFGADARLRQIDHLLHGRAIRLPALGVPLAQRTLLSGAQDAECITADELLRLMANSFAEAKSAVLAVDAAWKTLAAGIDRAESHLRQLGRRCQVCGLGLHAELDSAARLLDRVREELRADPFGAEAELEQRIEPSLARVARAVEQVEAVHRQLADARAALDRLQVLHREVLAAAEQARARIAGCEALPGAVPEVRLEQLRHWLARLEQRLQAGHAEAVAVGLRSWNSVVAECVSAEMASLEAHRAPLAMRNELRGRLDALKAKARAHGLAESQAIAASARQAESLLYVRPVNVQQASAAVASLERTLSAAGKGVRQA